MSEQSELMDFNLCHVQTPWNSRLGWLGVKKPCCIYHSVLLYVHWICTCIPLGRPPQLSHTALWVLAPIYFLQVMLNVLGCRLTYEGQAETNAWAWFNIALRPWKPWGSLGWTAQDGHLDSHTAPELWPIYHVLIPDIGVMVDWVLKNQWPIPMYLVQGRGETWLRQGRESGCGWRTWATTHAELGPLCTQTCQPAWCSSKFSVSLTACVVFSVPWLHSASTACKCGHQSVWYICEHVLLSVFFKLSWLWWINNFWVLLLLLLWLWWFFSIWKIFNLKASACLLLR